jgi:hypothetical protein
MNKLQPTEVKLVDQENDGQTNTHYEGTSPNVLYRITATAADNFHETPVSRKSLNTCVT